MFKVVARDNERHAAALISNGATRQQAKKTRQEELRSAADVMNRRGINSLSIETYPIGQGPKRIVVILETTRNDRRSHLFLVYRIRSVHKHMACRPYLANAAHNFSPSSWRPAQHGIHIGSPLLVVQLVSHPERWPSLLPVVR